MEFFVMIVFGTALGLILLLFILKRIEVGRERRLAEPLRGAADRGAVRLKGALEAAEGHLENTPFFLSALARWGVHIGALSFARLARSSAEYAHGLADLVSHKHRFERRETKSQYLKMVGERSTTSAPEMTQPATPAYVSPQPESRPQYQYTPPEDTHQSPHEAKKSSGRRRKRKDDEVATS